MEHNQTEQNVQDMLEMMEEAGYSNLTDEELRELCTVTPEDWMLINYQTEKALREMKEQDALGVF